MAKNNSLGLILWDSENVCSTKRMVFSGAEASESLQDFIMLLVLYLNAELCAQPLPLWGDFSLEMCRLFGITEVVCYCRAVVCMEADDLCLCIQTAAISVSVLPKPVPFQKVVNLFDFSPFSNRGVYAFSWGIVLEFRIQLCFQGVTPCCSHLWGRRPGKAFGSTSEEGYSLDESGHDVQPFWVLQVSVSPEHSDLAD